MWQPLFCGPLCEDHFRHAITSLVEVISLPQWPFTWKLLAYPGSWLQTVGCHVEWRIAIKLQSTWEWLLWRRVPIPMWWMIFISESPRLIVILRGSSWTIIRGSRIIVTELSEAKSATWSSHIRSLCWRSICRHALWTKKVDNSSRCTMWGRINRSLVEYITGSSDLWQNEWLLISHSVVINCCVSLHLWSITPTRLRKWNLNHTHPPFLCYMLEFI